MTKSIRGAPGPVNPSQDFDRRPATSWPSAFSCARGKPARPGAEQDAQQVEACLLPESGEGEGEGGRSCFHVATIIE
jgi:hypothetical protein